MGTSDGELLARIAEQDYDAFNILYARYNRLFMTWTYKRTRSSQTSEDIMQIFWANLWNTPSVFNVNEMGTAKQSFLKILSFRITDYLRAMERKEETTADGDIMSELSSDLSYTHVFEDLQEDEIHKILNKVLTTLPQLHQDIYHLRWHQHYSTKETAESLGICEKVVRERYKKTLTYLKKRLTEDYLNDKKTNQSSAIVLLLLIRLNLFYLSISGMANDFLTAMGIR
ncbi:RNA polymerase sigma factor [Bacteroides graminisolvens]|jgi:RNA polymerase sigma-70 factor (ECF subfamily)|uniref:RNA polymerase sigma factor n=1 Tax=Bacteroides graminisolvens TaxID=477666 RepID=UPI0029C62C51|nr:sigma-70 family RNA polymerase sigma factor [Bacteroides graminisolvens]